MGYAGAATAGLGIMSPIDLVPDFIPVTGWLDDLLYLPAALVFLGIALYQRVMRAGQGHALTGNGQS